MSSSHFPFNRSLLAALLCSWTICLAVTGCSSPKAPPSPSEKKTLLIFAGSSTAPPLDEALKQFGEKNPRLTLRTSYGSSAALARQIEAGAEADLFLSADERWGDYLAKNMQLPRRRFFLGNRLAVVVPADSTLKIQSLHDLAQEAIRRVAVADPVSVPAGMKAKEALEKSGTWEKVSKKLVAGDDVRRALSYVESGAAEAGIVYVSDTVGNSKVRLVLTIEENLHAAIRYELILTPRGQGNADAEKLHDYLTSPEAGTIFARFGFESRE